MYAKGPLSSDLPHRSALLQLQHMIWSLKQKLSSTVVLFLVWQWGFTAAASLFEPGLYLFRCEMSVYTLMCSGIWQKYESLGLTFSKWHALPKPLLTGGQNNACFTQFVAISVLATCPAFTVLVYEKWSYRELFPVSVNVLVHLLLWHTQQCDHGSCVLLSFTMTAVEILVSLGFCVREKN